VFGYVLRESENENFHSFSFARSGLEEINQNTDDGRKEIETQGRQSSILPPLIDSSNLLEASSLVFSAVD